MKKSLVCAVAVLVSLFGTQAAIADDDFYGFIEQRPAGKTGIWTIGGKSFRVNHDTELEADHGALKVGACVQVDIDDGEVDSIETEPARKCPGKAPAAGAATARHLHAAQPLSTPADDFYGFIEQRPAGKTGIWTVGGKSFRVNHDTELEADHGPLKVGACVEVDVDDGEIETIETEPARKCPGKAPAVGAATARHLHAAQTLSTPADDFYGFIEQRPAGKTGIWTVGGKSFRVEHGTKLEADHGPLKVGACVEVDVDDGEIETIETERKHKCNR